MMSNVPEKVVLLVDDDREFHEIYTFQLEEFSSLKFLCAHSGEEAYELMSKEKVDIVITDLDMPQGNGLWLLDKLTTNFTSVPVIIASSCFELSEKELIKLGASGFVPKLNLEMLPQKLGEFI